VRYPDPEPRVLRPAVFFDRDGVVNDPGGHYYVTRWEDFVFQPGITGILRRLKSSGYALVLVTSQRGVGKGQMSEADLAEIHRRMQAHLASLGCAFDAIHAYTGLAADGPGAKPDPHFVHLAAASLGLDLGASWMIGDADRDIEMGRRAGLRTIRVGGHGAVGVAADFAFATVRDLAAGLPVPVNSDPRPDHSSRPGLSAGTE
jgi:histidinol-phosphate phosphatase family protein